MNIKQEKRKSDLCYKWTLDIHFNIRFFFFIHSFIWLERPYFVTHEYTTLLRTQTGKNVSIACEAQGKPSPFVSWTKKIDGID